MEIRNIHSRYVNGGAPTHCANPHCREPFVASAWRGKDNLYYCNSSCEEFAAEARPEFKRRLT